MVTAVASARHGLIVVLLASLLALNSLSHTAADTKPPAPTNAISLSPFLQNITVTTSDTSKTFNLELTNHSKSVQELDLTSRDFGSLNDTGGVLLISDPKNNYSQHYGLTSWLTLGTDTVVLQPDEARSVLVSINNRDDLQPGGHYGAVVVSVRSLDDKTGNHVVVNQQLLSLVLVDKQGGDHFDMQLKSVEQNGNWLHLPSSVKLQFQNPGNVHVTPRGQVLLRNPAGSVVAKGFINSESAFILPASLRDMYVSLSPVGHSLPLPGVYHVEVDYRYDGLNTSAIKRYAVHFINLKLYLAIAITLVVIIVVLRRRFRSQNQHLQSAGQSGLKTD